MNKNLIVILVLAIVVSAGVLAVTFLGGDDRPAPPSDADDAGPRIVCLNPGMTETLFAIGAGKDVVGISDHVTYPPEARELPTLGHSMAPNYESIAKLEPTLILAENSVQTKKDELKVLGNTHILDWLTIEQVAASTRKLGELAGHKEEAEKLAKRYDGLAATPESMNAPTVLAVIAGRPDTLGPIYFIRRNCIHGVMLRAAGAKNVVKEDVPANSPPNMSIEKVLELQPDVILILSNDGEMKSGVKDAHVAEWMKLETLYAVEKSRVAVIAIDGLTLPGPRVFENIPKLKAVIEDLMK